MLITEANKLLREGIIITFFTPQLRTQGYKASKVKHPTLKTKGLSKDNILHIYFDTETGLDYPDGDEWFIVEYLLPHNVDMPDALKNPDLFTSVTAGKGVRQWRHRELVRYRQGKVKRLEEAVIFIDRKAWELRGMLKQSGVLPTSKVRQGKKGVRKRQGE
ncbi:MAG: hypothetical protein HY619_06740 [Thaumarchaeota archaeon]|nr:hypothetical protein [Nitrososphaerota archaeon]